MSATRIDASIRASYHPVLINLEESTMLDVLHAPSVLLKAKLLRGLADPSRLSILETLRAGPLSVGEIVGTTALSQPNTSNHLACLLGCGLVTREPHGRQMIYRLGDGVDALLSMVDEMLAGTASGVEFCNRSEEPL